MAESEDKEQMHMRTLEIFEPLIIEKLDPKEVLPHMPFILDGYSEEILSRQDRDGAQNAAQVFVEKLKKVAPSQRTWFATFLESLRRTDNEILLGALEGSNEVKDVPVYKNLLHAFMPQILADIKPTQILPKLLSSGCLSTGDIEEITALEDSKGPRYAALHLLLKLPKKKASWFIDFLHALNSTKGYKHLAESIAPELMKLSSEAEYREVEQLMGDVIHSQQGNLGDSNPEKMAKMAKFDEGGACSSATAMDTSEAIHEVDYASIGGGDDLKGAAAVPEYSPPLTPDERQSPEGEERVDNSNETIYDRTSPQIADIREESTDRNLAASVPPGNSASAQDDNSFSNNLSLSVDEKSTMSHLPDKRNIGKEDQQGAAPANDDNSNNENGSNDGRERKEEDAVETEELELRSYQEELAQQANRGENVIIVAPTGSGKTHVALGISKNHLDDGEDLGMERKIAFLVPTVELVTQQAKQYRKYLSQYRTKVLSGEIKDGQRLSIFLLLPECDVIVMTPQILLDAIRRDVPASIAKFSLIIFDECHHATKEHTYNMIMGIYMDVKLTREPATDLKLPQIVGLTASVGVGKARDLDGAVVHILRLCGNLDAVAPVTVRRSVDELKKHVNLPDDESVRVHGRKVDNFAIMVSKLMSDIEDMMRKAPEVKKVEGVSGFDALLNAPSGRGTDPYTQWLSRVYKGIARIHDQKLRRFFFAGHTYLKNYNNSLFINSDCRTKDALEYLKKELKPPEDQYKDGNDEWLEDRFNEIMGSLEEIARTDKNPKLVAVEKCIMTHHEENADMRVIMFCKTREMTVALKNWMMASEKLKCLQPACLVGSNASVRHGGMTGVQKDDALKYFQSGKHKILIATSVAEEGLDISKCDLVIKYQHVTNEIAMVQARGRARAEDSTYVVVGEAGQGTAEKEQLNKLREKLMCQALEKLASDIDRDGERVKQQIRRYQEEAQIERQTAAVGKEAKDALRKFASREEDWQIRCFKCDSLACTSSDIRAIAGSHHVVVDETFMERAVVEAHDRPGRYDMFEKTHKLYCKKCHQDWGIRVIYKSTPFEVIKISSFVLVNPQNRRSTQRKWKDVPFHVDTFLTEDLQNRLDVLKLQNETQA